MQEIALRGNGILIALTYLSNPKVNQILKTHVLLTIDRNTTKAKSSSRFTSLVRMYRSEMTLDESKISDRLDVVSDFRAQIQGEKEE